MKAITKTCQIDGPATWVELRREYDTIWVEPFPRRQSKRLVRLRNMLRQRWQTFTLTERNECIRLYGQHINIGA